MRRNFERLRGWLKETASSHGRAILLFAVVALVIAVPTFVLAQTTPPAPGGTAGGVTSSFTNELISLIAGALSWFLGIVVNFLGKLILLLVNILLGFLSYNDFARAAPVEIGWKLLRDLSNMFFIVILMLCAFSTIIGYNPEFHVRKVLPKLLFTAVAINFSKTIIGLMIDASQVVMLTFVNAFQAVGVGNFVNALHLQNVSALTPAQGNPGTNILVEVILAYMLAIMMLVLSIGVILMMIIFVVGRIVGLWMALIFAPLAFLVGAIPRPVAEKISIAKKYWPQLNGLLFGGPTIAFFLWLTFATVNSLEGDQSLNLFQNVTTGAVGGASGANSIFNVTQDATAYFLNQIGSVRNLASFLIAITMLMLGLDAGMEAVSSMGNQTLTGLAQTVKKKSSEYATKAAVAPYAAAWGAAKGTANYVDRRADISGRAAALARAIPLVDHFAGDKLRKVQFARRKEWEEQKKFRLDDYKQSTRGFEKSIAKGKARTAAALSPIFGHQGDTMGYAAILEADGSDEKFKKRSKELATPIEDKLKADGVHAPVAKNIASQRANQQAVQERLESLNGALRTLDKERDKETYQKIEDQIKQVKKENPAYLEGADREKAMAGVAANLASLSDEQTSNLEVLFNSTNQELRDQAFQQDANGKYTIKDPIALSQMVAAHKGKPTEKKFDALVNFMKNSPTGVTMDQLRGYSIQKGKDDNYGVYDKASGTKVATESQRIAEKALLDRVQNPAKHGRAYSDERGDYLEYDPDATDLNTAPAGNAVLAAIPHIGLAETFNRAGDADGAVSDLIERQFEASGTVINTNSADYDKANDYIEIYNDRNSTEQQKFLAQSEFQKDFQRVEAIMDDVPSSTVDPNKRIELMASMDRHRADRFVTAPSNMLDPDQKKTAMKVKEMAKTTANSLHAWRANNVQAANDALFVDEDIPMVREAARITKQFYETGEMSDVHQAYLEKVEKNGAIQRAREKGFITDERSLSLDEKKVQAMAQDAKIQEGIKYNRATRFVMNVTRESKKGSQRRR